MATIKQVEMFSLTLFRPGEKKLLGKTESTSVFKRNHFRHFLLLLDMNKASALVGLDLTEPTRNIQLLGLCPDNNIITCKTELKKLCHPVKLSDALRY